MLRLQSETGWWLISHPDHAHLAGGFASHWGNKSFTAPEPRAHLLRGIYAHDDGWRARDAAPLITKQGKPAAFSVELVGTYSAFEEIDLAAYLAVRRSAVQLIADQDPYAAILISMHTYNLLTDRADRSTIRPDQLPLLDVFLAEQKALQQDLRQELIAAKALPDDQLTQDAFTNNFKLLQACDNLSLLSCVDYAGNATLLWPQKTNDGSASEVQVERLAERNFRLTPYPFATAPITFTLQARHVEGQTFASSDELQSLFVAAPIQDLTVTISA